MNQSFKSSRRKKRKCHNKKIHMKKIDTSVFFLLTFLEAVFILKNPLPITEK